MIPPTARTYRHIPRLACARVVSSSIRLRLHMPPEPPLCLQRAAAQLSTTYEPSHRFFARHSSLHLRARRIAGLPHLRLQGRFQRHGELRAVARHRHLPPAHLCQCPLLLSPPASAMSKLCAQNHLVEADLDAVSLSFQHCDHCHPSHHIHYCAQYQPTRNHPWICRLHRKHHHLLHSPVLVLSQTSPASCHVQGKDDQTFGICVVHVRLRRHGGLPEPSKCLCLQHSRHGGGSSHATLSEHL